jgi:hypothetical protein
MDRIEETRPSFSSDGDGSDSELSPGGELRPPGDLHPNPRTRTIPGGGFELPIASPSTAVATPFNPPALRERALSATDALFQSSRKRASSEADKTKPAKESGRRTLFSRPSKIMTNLRGGNKDEDRNKAVEKEDSPLSPTYFRPFASPSHSRPRHSQDELYRNVSLGSLSATTTPAESNAYSMLSPGLATTSTNSTLRPQLFYRTRERKDSNPSSILSVSTSLSKQNSSESNLSHSPASPSLFPSLERIPSSVPKSVSTQDIRQASAGHYTLDTIILDDTWPLLRARGLGLFHGEGMRINIEELNKLVVYHPFIYL